MLRWFHPLAWLLLAAASGLYGWGGPSSAAKGLAGLAGGCYALFFLVTATARRHPRT